MRAAPTRVKLHRSNAVFCLGGLGLVSTSVVRFSRDLRERVQETFYDREARRIRPLFWGLVGLIMAAVGLSIFAMDVAAALAGHSTVTVSRRHPYASKTIPVEVRALFGLFFGTAGVVTIDNTIRHGYPAVLGRSSYRWFLRLIVVPLVLATLVLGGFVVYVHYVR